MTDLSRIDRIRQQYEQISLAMRMYPYWTLTRGKRPICLESWTDSDALLTFEGALKGLVRPRSVVDGAEYIFQEVSTSLGR